MFEVDVLELKAFVATLLVLRKFVATARDCARAGGWAVAPGGAETAVC
jgi:hypothetical protein